MLTRCPVSVGLYDRALKVNYFVPKREDQRSPELIGRFTCASLEHYHYENGLVCGVRP